MGWQVREPAELDVLILALLLCYYICYELAIKAIMSNSKYTIKL